MCSRMESLVAVGSKRNHENLGMCRPLALSAWLGLAAELEAEAESRSSSRAGTFIALGHIDYKLYRAETALTSLWESQRLRCRCEKKATILQANL